MHTTEQPFIVDNYDVNLPGPVHSSHQAHFDIGGPAGTRDQDHRARLRGRLPADVQEFVEILQDFRPFDYGDVAWRQERDHPRVAQAGPDDQRAGFGERVFARGDRGVGCGASLA